MKRLPFRSVLVLATLILPAMAIAQSSPPPVPVETATARFDQFAATMWVPGTVISRHDASVASETTGRITWVAEVGSFIEAGEPLAVVDDETLRLNLRDAEARIGSLKAQRDYQESQLSRLNTLAENSNASVTQIDEARSQLAMTHHSITQAEVARDQVKRQLAQTRVEAPFSGQVVERLIEVGEYVNAGIAVARLVDTVNKEIRVQAPLAVAPYIANGMNVAVTINGNESYTDISMVIPVGDERSRMFEVRLEANATEWIIGSAVRVALPNSEQREMVAVPRDALIMRGNDMYVFRVSDNTAEKINVRTGIGIGEMVEVIGEIVDGDELVVRGAERLQPGQPITVSNT